MYFEKLRRDPALETPEAKLGVSGDIPSDTEQATGLDKNEHDALMAGVEVNE